MSGISGAGVGGRARPEDAGAPLRFEPTYLVTAAFAADAAARREPHRAAHLAHVRALLADGTALVAGARADLTASVLVLRAADATAARALVEQDPYWRHGVWTTLDVADYLAATSHTLGRT
ncbi:YciI family protein [Micromonospora haikouensis]|uniref:YciI family protein n=1 Tax=Micromonospora haikouensis TaxID=686309 RepID=UPI00367402A3